VQDEIPPESAVLDAEAEPEDPGAGVITGVEGVIGAGV